MARRRASLALAAIVVVARLASSGATAAAATPAEETIGAERVHHHAPSRSLRSPHGVHARAVARGSSLAVCLAVAPLAFEGPPRMLVPPTVIPSAPPVTAYPPPVSLARAPPR